MFNDIAIDFWTSWSLVSMKDIIRIRTYNLSVRFSKFTLNIKDIQGVWRVSLQNSLERNFVPSLKEEDIYPYYTTLLGNIKIVF